MPARSKNSAWDRIIQNVTTPLGFYVLALLIIEATLATVLTFAKLPDEKRWDGFLWMIGIFIGVVIVVTFLTVCTPKNLLFGKEEHLSPQLAESALRDQIEDIVVSLVKSESLKKES